MIFKEKEKEREKKLPTREMQHAKEKMAKYV
jgi:hypothetical protein